MTNLQKRKNILETILTPYTRKHSNKLSNLGTFLDLSVEMVYQKFGGTFLEEKTCLLDKTLIFRINFQIFMKIIKNCKAIEEF